MEREKAINLKAMGQRIRKEREKLALSRADFAELIELSDYYVGQLERGERQMSLPVLIKIANCLHVSLDYLVLGSSGYNDYYICNGSMPSNLKSVENKEIYQLIEKCSPKELELITKLIKIIIPYFV